MIGRFGLNAFSEPQTGRSFHCNSWSSSRAVYAQLQTSEGDVQTSPDVPAAANPDIASGTAAVESGT